MSFFLPIVLLTVAALVAIANLCNFIETWLRRRRGIKIRYTSLLFVSAVCGCLVWLKARGTIGFWAFLPALLDPGTWLILPWAWYRFVQWSIREESYRHDLRKGKKK